ncbi:MAG: phosphoribosylglycinamide formyltransferase [Caulobacteraceae bacterium]|nr:phosphoribosylglycinamide formyltransferase [Caulobacteraceae bacterium]
MLKLGFLASGNGSSLRAIVAAIEAGDLDGEARLVVSNRREAPALAFAREHRIATMHIPTAVDPAGADARLTGAMTDAGADTIVLSGYLRRLGPVTLAAFEGRILNIHPALLPAHGGEGYYGRRVHESVIAAGDRISGATVHLVDGEYDHGAILAQARLELAPGETAESLERRVMALEPGLFVETLRRMATAASSSRISDNIS